MPAMSCEHYDHILGLVILGVSTQLSSGLCKFTACRQSTDTWEPVQPGPGGNHGPLDNQNALTACKEWLYVAFKAGLHRSMLAGMASMKLTAMSRQTLPSSLYTFLGPEAKSCPR